ncbi:MAG: NUDIX domain-containing protein [Ignavibacteria bacterium]
MNEREDIRLSIKAVIISDDKLLVIKKEDEYGFFYIIPGGGQEHGETIEQALLRECEEEVSLRVKMKRLLFIRDYIAVNHGIKEHAERNVHHVELMFQADIVSGMPAPGTVPDIGQLSVDWISLSDIETLRLYPQSIRKHLKNINEINETIYLGDVN